MFCHKPGGYRLVPGTMEGDPDEDLNSDGVSDTSSSSGASAAAVAVMHGLHAPPLEMSRSGMYTIAVDRFGPQPCSANALNAVMEITEQVNHYS